MRNGLLAVGLAFMTVLSLAAWAADEQGYAAHGTVKSADVSAGTVTIDHEDIPGLMMGMTMTFSVSDPGILRGIEPGTMVDFRVRKDGNRYIVTEIQPATAHPVPEGHGMMMKGCGGCCGAHNTIDTTSRLW